MSVSLIPDSTTQNSLGVYVGNLKQLVMFNGVPDGVLFYPVTTAGSNLISNYTFSSNDIGKIMCVPNAGAPPPWTLGGTGAASGGVPGMLVAKIAAVFGGNAIISGLDGSPIHASVSTMQQAYFGTDNSFTGGVAGTDSPDSRGGYNALQYAIDRGGKIRIGNPKSLATPVSPAIYCFSTGVTSQHANTILEGDGIHNTKLVFMGNGPGITLFANADLNLSTDLTKPCVRDMQIITASGDGILLNYSTTSKQLSPTGQVLGTWADSIPVNAARQTYIYQIELSNLHVRGFMQPAQDPDYRKSIPSAMDQGALITEYYTRFGAGIHCGYRSIMVELNNVVVESCGIGLWADAANSVHVRNGRFYQNGLNVVAASVWGGTNNNPWNEGDSFLIDGGRIEEPGRCGFVGYNCGPHLQHIFYEDAAAGGPGPMCIRTRGCYGDIYADSNFGNSTFGSIEQPDFSLQGWGPTLFRNNCWGVSGTPEHIQPGFELLHRGNRGFANFRFADNQGLDVRMVRNFNALDSNGNYLPPLLGPMPALAGEWNDFQWDAHSNGLEYGGDNNFFFHISPTSSPQYETRTDLGMTEGPPTARFYLREPSVTKYKLTYRVRSTGVGSPNIQLVAHDKVSTVLHTLAAGDDTNGFMPASSYAYVISATFTDTNTACWPNPNFDQASLTAGHFNQGYGPYTAVKFHPADVAAAPPVSLTVLNSSPGVFTVPTAGITSGFQTFELVISLANAPFSDAYTRSRMLEFSWDPSTVVFDGTMGAGIKLEPVYVTPDYGVTLLNAMEGAVTLTGAHGLTATAGPSGTITLDTPQDLRTTASPSFANLFCEQNFQHDGPTVTIAAPAAWRTAIGAASTANATILNGLSGAVTLSGLHGLKVVAPASGSLTIDTPQDLQTTASPTFAALTAVGAVSGGSISTGLLNASSVNAGFFVGDGTGLTNVTAANANKLNSQSASYYLDTSAGSQTKAGPLSISGAVTAGSFNGPGSGLTGTASNLNIGGNAATATSATQLNGLDATHYIDTSVGAQSKAGGLTLLGALGVGVTPRYSLDVQSAAVTSIAARINASFGSTTINNTQLRFAGGKALVDGVPQGELWAIGTDIAHGNGSRDFHFFDLVGSQCVTIQSGTGNLSTTGSLTATGGVSGTSLTATGAVSGSSYLGDISAVTLKTRTTLRNLSDILKESTSVAEFGVTGKPDIHGNPIDESAQFQAAVNAIVLTGGWLRIPAGYTIYLGSSISIPSGLRLVGDGWSRSRLLRLASLPNGVGLLDLPANTTNVEILAIGIDGQSGDNLTGALLGTQRITDGTQSSDPSANFWTQNSSVWIHYGCSNILFENVDISHSAAYPFFAQANNGGNITGITLRRCSFRNNRAFLGTNGGSDIDHAGFGSSVLFYNDGISAYLQDITVEDCYWQHIVGNACCWSHIGSTSYPAYNNRNFIFTGNVMEDVILDGTQWAGISGLIETDNIVRRFGFKCLKDDGSDRAAKWGVTIPVAFDTSGYLTNAVRSNNWAMGQGEMYDLDGCGQSAISNNVFISAWVTDDPLVTAIFSQLGQYNNGINGCIFANCGNTNGLATVNIYLTFIGNEIYGANWGAFRLYGSQHCLVTNNLSYHDSAHSTGWLQPIQIGNIPGFHGTDNDIRGNALHWAASQGNGIAEVPNGVQFTSSDCNRIAPDNKYIGCGAFLKDPQSGSNNSFLNLSSVTAAAANLIEYRLQAEGCLGSGTDNALSFYRSVTLVAWIANWYFPLNLAILDGNGHVQMVTRAGTTGPGPSAPAFSTTGGTTNDGGVIWKDQGLQTNSWAGTLSTTTASFPSLTIGGSGVVDAVGNLSGNSLSIRTPTPWIANHVYVVGNRVLDPNGNVQTAVIVTPPGHSGASAPIWSTAVGGATNDNNIVWSCTGAPAPIVDYAGNVAANTVLINGNIAIDTSRNCWFSIVASAGIYGIDGTSSFHLFASDFSNGYLIGGNAAVTPTVVSGSVVGFDAKLRSVSIGTYSSSPGSWTTTGLPNGGVIIDNNANIFAASVTSSGAVSAKAQGAGQSAFQVKAYTGSNLLSVVPETQGTGTTVANTCTLGYWNGSAWATVYIPGTLKADSIVGTFTIPDPFYPVDIAASGYITATNTLGVGGGASAAIQVNSGTIVNVSGGVTQLICAVNTTSNVTCGSLTVSGAGGISTSNGAIFTGGGIYTTGTGAIYTSGSGSIFTSGTGGIYTTNGSITAGNGQTISTTGLVSAGTVSCTNLSVTSFNPSSITLGLGGTVTLRASSGQSVIFTPSYPGTGSTAQVSLNGKLWAQGGIDTSGQGINAGSYAVNGVYGATATATLTCATQTVNINGANYTFVTGVSFGVGGNALYFSSGIFTGI